MEKIHLPPTIKSERITLKKHQAELAEMMFSFVDRDRERLREFLPWVYHTVQIADEANYIQMTQAKWESHELYDYGIFRNSDSQYLGNVGVHSIAWEHQRCELGYWILGEYEGQGYMSESVLALERVCFDLGFHRIEIRCSSRNRRSAQVPLRCGYRLEATLSQDSVEHRLYRDTLIFAKLKSRQPTALAPLVALDFVYLFTPDVHASKDWYQTVLGVDPVVDLDNYVEFRPGGHCGLCFHPADVKSPLTTGGSVGYWRVLNFKATVAHFQKHGAKIYRGPLEIGNGDTICQMLDPIGNVIGLVGVSA